MYVADYVLMEYGTGAIMAVPAHDERDYAFARAQGLPIRRVIEGASPAAADSVERSRPRGPPLHRRRPAGQLPSRLRRPGQPRGAGGDRAVAGPRGQGPCLGQLPPRDWLVSRQRYWGCPIPVVYCERCGMVPVPEEQLPVELPEIEDYAPRGRSPLAAATEWVTTRCPGCDGEARRETDTMDTFVDSSWYFLRYCDAANDEAAWDPACWQWMPWTSHRRRGARDPAPDVRALLHQGARGPRPPRLPGALPGAVHAGDGHQGRREDEQVSRQRRLAGAIVERYGADTARC